MTLPPLHAHLLFSVFAVAVLSTLDAIFTFNGLQSARYTEGNPWMAMAYEQGPVAFFLYKNALVYLGLTILWVRRHHRLAQVALRCFVLLYTFIAGNHIGVYCYYNLPESLVIWSF